MANNVTYGINLKASGSNQVAGEVKATDAALNKLADSAEKVNQASARQRAETKRLSGELDSLRASISPTYAAQQKLAQGTDVLNRSLAAGIINTREYKQAQDQLDRSVASRVSSNNGLIRSQTGLSDSSLALTGRLRGLASGLAVILALSAVSGKLDEYTRYNAQLKLTTDSELQYVEARKKVSAIAQESQTELAAVGTLYARLNTSLKDLNATQAQVADVTETVALGLKVSGATATEQASAILQLSQAFGSGVLRGEEFNAVNEAAPSLMRALAASIGVPVGALRNLASDGKITSEVLLKAFGDEQLLEKYRKQAKEIQTIGGAITGLKNTTLEAAGVLDEKTGIAKLFASGISSVASALQLLIDTAKAEPIDYGKFLPNQGQSLQLQGFFPAGGGVAAKGAIPGYQDRPIIDPSKQQYLPRGATFGGALPRIDYGNIGQVDAAYNKLKSTLASFQEKNPLKDLVSEQDKYNQRIKQLAEYERNGIVSVEQATRYRAQFREELNKAIKSSEKLSESETKAARDAEAYTKARLRYTSDRLAANQSLVASINQSTAATQAEIDNFGKLPSEITAVTVAKLELQKIDAANLRDNIAVNGIEAQIEAYKRLQAVQNDAEAGASSRANLERLQKQYEENEKVRVSAPQKANEQQQRDFEKTVDGIDQVFRLGFAGMLNRGETTWKSWSRSLITTFKTTVADTAYRLLAQPFVIKLVASILGVTGTSAAASAASSLIDTTTSSGSIFETLKGGLNSLNTNVVGSIEKLGVLIANGNGGIADAIGGALGQYASQISTGLAFLPAAISLLKGDLKSAAFQGAGAGIGFAVGGPAGAAIGSFLGGAVGSLFGGKKLPPRITSSQRGTLVDGVFSTAKGPEYGKPVAGLDGALNNLNETFSRNLSALLSSFNIDSRISTASIITKKKSYDTSFSGSVDGAGFSTYQKFGKKDSLQNVLNSVIDYALGPTLVAAIKASSLSQGVKSLFDGFADKAQVANLINATITLNSSQKQLADRFGLTVDAAAKVSKASGLAGDDLIKFVNDLAATSLAYKKQSDIILEARKNLETGVFSSIGSALPTSLDEFDNLLKSIDTSTAAGIKKFSELFGARNDFSNFTTAMDSIKDGVRAAVFGLKSPSEQLIELRQELSTSFGKLGLKVPGSIQELIDLSKTIDPTTSAGLDLAIAFPSLAAAIKEVQDRSDSLVSSLSALSEDSFTSLVDFAEYTRTAAISGVAAADQYFGRNKLPSFAQGTNYLPADSIIQAHKGERIIPAADNAELLARLNDPTNGAQAIIAAIENLHADSNIGQDAILLEIGKTYDILNKFDTVGLPPERELV